jgi:hypothetical protein
MSDNTQPQPRTCGGCKWFEPLCFDGYPWAIGKCTAMSDMGFRHTTRDDAGATDCPCWAAKEETTCT